MLTPPSWYAPAETFLLREGWPVLTIAAGVVIGVTLYLLLTRRAVALAGWLVYLYMP
jgi:hypothetical protein